MGKHKLAKDDKDFGKWMSTSLVPHKITIMRFELGFTIKKSRELFKQRLYRPEGTTDKEHSTLLGKALGVKMHDEA